MANPYLTPDRPIKTVTIPEFKKLKIDNVFSNGVPKPDILKKHFIEEGQLDPECALKIIKDATAAFKKQNNVIELQSPIIICGNVNGQFFDLIKIFEKGGTPVGTHYLFLGGYVNRGYFGIECVLYLYAMKLWHPMAFHLLRGNHECRLMTKFFMFKRECEIKYSVELYDAVMASFDTLPLAAVINGKYFCVHGGLSPDIPFIADINRINRFVEPPLEGPMCDLLWSDPSKDFGINLRSKDAFTPNTSRECSVYFSFRACCEFILVNQLLTVIRAHQVQEDGFRISRKNLKTGFPALITVFSSPNYADAYMNKGAIIRLDRYQLIPLQFTASTHPYWLPNMSDAFTWSSVFIGEKVTGMLATICSICSSEDETTDETIEKQAKEIPSSINFQSKIQIIERIARMFQTLREEHSSSLTLHGITPTNRYGYVEMFAGKSLEKILKQQGNKLLSFQEAKLLDKYNEKLPNEV